MEAEQAPDAAKLETTMVAKPKAAAKPKDASKSKKSGAPNTKSTLNKVQRGRVEKPAPRTRAAPKSYAELSANDDKEEDDRLSQMDGDNDEDIDEDINEDTNDELSQMDGENDKDIDEVTNDQLYDEEGEQSADEDEAENEYPGPRLTGIVNGFDLSELSPLAYRVLEGRGYIRNGQWMGGV